MKKKIEIIAEAGLNHNGNFKNALKLVKIAKEAKVDYVKFQLFKTENFINKNFKHHKVNYKKTYQRFKSLEFSLDQWKKIVDFAKKIKIKIFFSVFDLESFKLLKKLKIKIVKIPSGEINNFHLLDAIKKSKLKVILSTGMCNISEISEAIKKLKNCKINLMHCVSEYPTQKPNLKLIKILKDRFKINVGYSDHTKDTFTPALSVIAGANMIEKHFTYNKNQKVSDHHFSLNPQELKEMTRNIIFALNSLGEKEKKISLKEKKLQFFARKGLYLNKDKLKGQKITKNDLISLRPEGQIKLNNYHKILNKFLRKSVKKFQPLKLNDFKRK